MAINDPSTKSMPLPNYKPESDTHIADEFALIKKNMPEFSSYAYTIEKEVAAVPRTETDPNMTNKGIIPPTVVSAYQEPLIPDVFPQSADKIKSLDFKTNGLSDDNRLNLTKYYNLVLQLMNNKISVPQYYAEMPSIMQSIKGTVLTEEDWEDLRDSILRTQNYILHYLWTDMQNISKAMDTGFAKYQENINTWIDETNKWYNSDSYLPKDIVKLENLSNRLDPDSARHQLAQNMTDVMNSMGTRISSSKPVIKVQDPAQAADVNNFPTGKQLVWLELI